MSRLVQELPKILYNTCGPTWNWTTNWALREKDEKKWKRDNTGSNRWSKETDKNSNSRSRPEPQNKNADVVNEINQNQGWHLVCRIKEVGY